MVLAVSNANNVKIYSITSSGKSAIPDWLAAKNKKALKHDEEYRRRIELIQDFEFPEASTRLQMTRDKNFIIATGVYKPQMRVFELSQLAMKFDRHYDSENVQFQEMLSDDWTKIAMLQNDRTIEFHTQSGLHYKTRVPKFGRDMVYDFPTCDLLTVGASNEVWRLNMELGKFMNTLPTDLPGINCTAINPAHQLWSFGGDNGCVEFWHPYQRHKIASLDVSSILFNSMPAGSLETIPEITKIKFNDDGLTFALGTSTGQVALFDLRKPSPLLIKDHQYGYPIKSLEFHSTGNVVSSDTKILKIWDQHNGKIFTSIEPSTDINDVLTDGTSGLVMMANEGVQIQSYYIPQLGNAPKWCPFLDNLTEELEENPTQTIYDDYKFINRKELYKLGLDHLIGTNLLRAYMHGFFVDLRLYEKAKAITNPFSYEEFKKQQVQRKIEKERSSRISAAKKLPKINRNLAQKLFQAEPEEGGKQSKKKKTLPTEDSTTDNPLGDDRFKALFADEDFEVDENDPEYLLRHPALKQKQPRKSPHQQELADKFTGSDEEEEITLKSHPLLQAKNPAQNIPIEDKLRQSTGSQRQGSHKKFNGSASMNFTRGRMVKIIDFNY